jgi:hypothetical protein
MPRRTMPFCHGVFPELGRCTKLIKERIGAPGWRRRRRGEVSKADDVVKRRLVADVEVDGLNQRRGSRRVTTWTPAPPRTATAQSASFPFRLVNRCRMFSVSMMVPSCLEARARHQRHAERDQGVSLVEVS